MLGIRGLDPFGLTHAMFGIAAIILGVFVLLLEKGTVRHRRIGVLYAMSMVLLNGSALAIYDLFGGFGPFHVLALISLATVAVGVLHVWLRWPRRGWMESHAHAMSWSYAGLVAAFVAEVTTRVPGVDFVLGVVAPSVAVTVAAAFLIHHRVPRTIARVRPSSPVAILLLLLLALPGSGRLGAQTLASDERIAAVTVRAIGFKHSKGVAMIALTTEDSRWRPRR